MTQEIVFSTNNISVTVGDSPITFIVGSTGPPGPTGAIGSGYTYEQEIPPISPSDGDTWFVPSTGAIYTYVLSLASWIQHITSETAIASNISYDNTTSSLSASEIQNAIDELDSTLDLKPDVFTELSDVPNSYIGQAGLGLKVNNTETALEFTVLDINPNVLAPSSSSGTLVLDYSSSNIFSVILTESITTLTLSNFASSGTLTEIILISTQNGTGGFSYTWPVNFVWSGGSAPAQSTGPNEIDIYRFRSIDGGTVVFAEQQGANMS